MPLYEYECEACGHRFEVIQKFSDSPIGSCLKCGGPVHKLLSSPAIQFKGSGWYITDYARAGQPDSTNASAKTDAGTTPADKASAGDTGESAGRRQEGVGEWAFRHLRARRGAHPPQELPGLPSAGGDRPLSADELHPGAEMGRGDQAVYGKAGHAAVETGARRSGICQFAGAH